MNKQSVILSILFMLTIEDYFNIATPVTKIDTPTVSYRKPPEERRKLPLFPKTNKKFVVTEASIEKNTYSVPARSPFKKPLMPKFVISEKKTEGNNVYHYKAPVSRPSLMKHKKFFIDLATSYPREEISYEEDVSDEYENINESQTQENKTIDETVSEELDINKSDVEFVTESMDVLEDAVDSKKDFENTSNTFVDDSVIHDNDNDGEEFIFINNGNSAVKKDESIKVNKPVIADKSRTKRKVNIIEEENSGTTISGFKYTGKVFHSSSDLSFKNINI